MAYQENEQLAWQAMEAGRYEVALPLLKALAERNSEYALLSLGWIYETGALGEPDKTAARSFYEHAAQLGNAAAHGRLGSLLLDEGQEERAKATFTHGAKLGDKESKSMLGRFSDRDQEQLAYEAIIAGEYKEALRLLKGLAADSSEYALLSLGWLYESANLGTPDLNLAHSYYERAAKQGSAEAYRRIGQLWLDEGQEEQARAAFQQGSEAGNISCMYWLGKMMQEGSGGEADVDRGTKWLEAAAAQGHIYAKRRLLAIEGEKVGSILRKLLIRARILRLAKDVAREVWKDPDSDKVR
jgi:TPR repeat protein